MSPLRPLWRWFRRRMGWPTRLQEPPSPPPVAPPAPPWAPRPGIWHCAVAGSRLLYGRVASNKRMTETAVDIGIVAADGAIHMLPKAPGLTELVPGIFVLFDDRTCEWRVAVEPTAMPVSLLGELRVAVEYYDAPEFDTHTCSTVIRPIDSGPAITVAAAGLGPDSP